MKKIKRLERYKNRFAEIYNRIYKKKNTIIIMKTTEKNDKKKNI